MNREPIDFHPRYKLPVKLQAELRNICEKKLRTHGKDYDFTKEFESLSKRYALQQWLIRMGVEDYMNRRQEQMRQTPQPTSFPFSIGKMEQTTPTAVSATFPAKTGENVTNAAPYGSATLLAITGTEEPEQNPPSPVSYTPPSSTSSPVKKPKQSFSVSRFEFLEKLEAIFQSDCKNIPANFDKKALLEKTGMTKSQFSTWYKERSRGEFQRKRRVVWPKIEDELVIVLLAEFMQNSECDRARANQILSTYKIKKNPLEIVRWFDNTKFEKEKEAYLIKKREERLEVRKRSKEFAFLNYLTENQMKFLSWITTRAFPLMTIEILMIPGSYGDNCIIPPHDFISYIQTERLSEMHAVPAFYEEKTKSLPEAALASLRTVYKDIDIEHRNDLTWFLLVTSYLPISTKEITYIYWNVLAKNPVTARQDSQQKSTDVLSKQNPATSTPPTVAINPMKRNYVAYRPTQSEVQKREQNVNSRPVQAMHATLQRSIAPKHVLPPVTIPSAGNIQKHSRPVVKVILAPPQYGTPQPRKFPINVLCQRVPQSARPSQRRYEKVAMECQNQRRESTSHLLTFSSASPASVVYPQPTSFSETPQPRQLPTSCGVEKRSLPTRPTLSKRVESPSTMARTLEPLEPSAFVNNDYRPPQVLDAQRTACTRPIRSLNPNIHHLVAFPSASPASVVYPQPTSFTETPQPRQLPTSYGVEKRSLPTRPTLSKRVESLSTMTRTLEPLEHSTFVNNDNRPPQVADAKRTTCPRPSQNPNPNIHHLVAFPSSSPAPVVYPQSTSFTETPQPRQLLTSYGAKMRSLATRPALSELVGSPPKMARTLEPLEPSAFGISDNRPPQVVDAQRTACRRPIRSLNPNIHQTSVENVPPTEPIQHQQNGSTNNQFVHHEQLKAEPRLLNPEDIKKEPQDATLQRTAVKQEVPDEEVDVKPNIQLCQPEQRDVKPVIASPSPPQFPLVNGIEQPIELFPQAARSHLPNSGEGNPALWTAEDVVDWASNFLIAHQVEVMRNANLNGIVLRGILMSREASEQIGFDYITWYMLRSHFNKAINTFSGF